MAEGLMVMPCSGAPAIRPYTVWLVEDEPAIASALMLYLQQAGYAATHIAHGDDAWSLLHIQAPDVLILDWMLPGRDGAQLCAHARGLYPALAIVMLTARVSENDVVQAFDEGADDYVAKPFRPQELMRRIAALLRRREVLETAARTSAPLATHASAAPRVLVWHAGHDCFYLRGQTLVLTQHEKRLLRLLYQHAPQALSRAQLLRLSLESDQAATLRSVDSHIKNLRKKLKLATEAVLIEAEYGVGYRLVWA